MRSYYASFDAFPTSKGASTHIDHSLQALSEIADKVDVFCLQGNSAIDPKLADDVEIHPFFYENESQNYLERAQLFSEKVYSCTALFNEKGIGQFRDIWSGLGMIKQAHLKTVFEVNALTSIELPVRFPLLTPSLIAEIQNIELTCLEACDHIVTPSAVTKKYLIEKFSIANDKISVITNGAEAVSQTEKPIDLPAEYIVYFGALQPWQGLDVLLKSFRYLRDYEHLKLVICSSVKEKATRAYHKLIENLGIQDQVIFRYELEKEELFAIIQHAKASIVPLKFGDRNVIQGCCPIKIIESMACKTPIIVSELPVTQELLTEDEAYFFWPEDEQDLSRCIRFVLDNLESASTKAEKAFNRFQQQFTWHHHNEKLQKVYQNLM
ncbi:glycosyltransferase family 4 protein [Chryseobacterium fluminis]|uniref:glycosyltransferase family 4 protein n=1 Tax=Chryseobacterium fluminis TaxID=2983606 RepID=UPI00225B4C41|nr:glycosyltransferase family 4 protein [Chryseobacterium sp. MMS21-Ot14]UZT97941.1 glycosyltransferase family 4 protein [Chryseobacterium sp. MMS21-Ot14]